VSGLPSLPRGPFPFVPDAVRNSTVPAVRSERPTRLSGDAFEAWHGNGVPIDVSAAETMDEAVNIAAPQSGHKLNFVIQQTRRDARRFLHFFGVTKSTKRFTRRPALDGAYDVREGVLEPKHLLTMQVYAPLQPVAPWKWSAEDYSGEKHGICPDLIAAALVQG
jgi:hypothetical protein